MASKVYLLVSKGEVWASHKEVRRSLSECYLSRPPKGFEIKKLVVPSQGLGKKTWMKLTEESFNNNSPLHIVVIDGGVPLLDLAFWAKWMNPKTTRFHLHAWSDLIIRLPEWQQTLKELNGFLGSIRVCSEAMKEFAEKVLGKAQYTIIPLPIHDHFFQEAPTISKKQKQLAYVGRINIDKGLNELISWWESIERTDEAISLYGKPSHESNVSWHEQFDKKQKELEQKVKDSQIPVRYLKGRPTLLNKLHQTDLVISCSTFMCEEFGLAIGEALAAGKIIMLSKWGGHAEFKDAPGVLYLPLKNQFPPVVDESKIQKIFEDIPWKKRKILERKNKSWAKNNLTFKVVSKRINHHWADEKKLPKLKTIPQDPLRILWKSFSNRRIFF